MARIARLMVEGHPFHVTHRGNQRRMLFHSDRHRVEYLSFLHRYAERFGMAVWAYCLMPNHVHLLAVGRDRASIPKAIGNAHRAYARLRHIESEVTGHLWANRFFSTLLDELRLWAAVRYVELNPVRAGFVRDATEFPWSSAKVHAGLVGDALLAPNRPFPGPIRDWRQWLQLGLEEEVASRLRRNTLTGRPTGSERFVAEVETLIARRERPPGPRSER